jgi:hypothetical protein
MQLIIMWRAQHIIFTDDLDIQSSRCHLEQLKYRLRYHLNNKLLLSRIR